MGAVLFEPYRSKQYIADMCENLTSLNPSERLTEPIVVTAYSQRRDVYNYVLTDGNHRAAAYCALDRPTIKAEILGVVDLTQAIAIIKNKKELWLKISDDEYIIAMHDMTPAELAVAKTVKAQVRHFYKWRERMEKQNDEARIG